MKVEFNTNRLRPMAVTLRRQAPNVVPKAKTRLLHAIVDFAVYSGLREIPRPVVERLRGDRFFPYIFTPVIDHDNFYHFSQRVKYYEEQRRELRAVLAGEAAGNDRLLSQGLKLYMNNFPNSMPGGINRKMAAEEPEYYGDSFVLFGKIDELLAARNLTVEAKRLGLAARGEIMSNFQGSKEGDAASYREQLPHLKLCLEIFEELIAKHGYDAGYLWR